jgi:GTPase
MPLLMFLDCVTIQVESGKGGNGMVAWRKEKYVAFGGPSGGDGGRGGCVYLQASARMQTLVDFQLRSCFKAEDGVKGGPKNMHGHKGEDFLIQVPLGTSLYDDDDDRLLADLVEDGQKVLVAHGGRGGRGNARFSSSRKQAPYFAEPGEPAITRNLRLELKSLADVGLIGMPNAGKSTLISVISSAKPKIANYPFTTLSPNLGVVRYQNSDDGYVVADIPGLIEGASQGIGLGHDFLRHVERTRLLLHLVDVTACDGGTPLENYQTVAKELALYSEKLATKPCAIVLSKTDALDDEELAEVIAAFEAEGLVGKDAAGQSLAEEGKLPLLLLSSATRQGLPELRQYMEQTLQSLPKPEPMLAFPEDPKATANDDSDFEVHGTEGEFTVLGGKIERWLLQTDLKESAALRHFWKILVAMGVVRELKRKGAKPGDTIYIGDTLFDFQPDPFEGNKRVKRQRERTENKAQKKQASKLLLEAEAKEATKNAAEGLSEEEAQWLADNFGITEAFLNDTEDDDDDLDGDFYDEEETDEAEETPHNDTAKV